MNLKYEVASNSYGLYVCRAAHPEPVPAAHGPGRGRGGGQARARARRAARPAAQVHAAALLLHRHRRQAAQHYTPELQDSQEVLLFDRFFFITYHYFVGRNVHSQKRSIKCDSLNIFLF